MPQRRPSASSAPRGHERADRRARSLGSGGSLAIVRGQRDDVVVLQSLDERRHDLGLAHALAHQDELVGQEQLGLAGERGRLLHLGVAVLAVAGARTAAAAPAASGPRAGRSPGLAKMLRRSRAPSARDRRHRIQSEHLPAVLLRGRLAAAVGDAIDGAVRARRTPAASRRAAAARRPGGPRTCWPSSSRKPVMNGVMVALPPLILACTTS